MTLEKAIRLARKWAAGHVCTLKEGEAQEYHQMCAEALEKSRWISVTERLPEDDGDYLCYCPVLNIGGKDIPRYEVYGFTLDAESNSDLKMSGNKGAAWYWYDSEYGYCSTRSVTHWMKPPEPPTEEEV